MRQRARRRRALGVRHRARRHQFPAVPVEDLGLVAAQRLAAFPRARQPRLAAGMTELEAGDRAVRLDEGGAARQPRNEIVVPQPGVADRAAAVARHLGRFHDDEPGAALGIFAGVDQMPVGRKALDRRILMHRRHHDAVLEAHAPESRVEKTASVASSRSSSGFYYFRRGVPLIIDGVSGLCQRFQRRPAGIFRLGCPVPARSAATGCIWRCGRSAPANRS